VAAANVRLKIFAAFIPDLLQNTATVPGLFTYPGAG
jgi:hypothetical protein